MKSLRTTALCRTLPRALLYGLLWAVAITARETMMLPFGQFDSARQMAVMGPILFMYVIDGVLFAWIALVLEPRIDSLPKFACLIVASALVIAVLHQSRWGLLRMAGFEFGFEVQLGESMTGWSNLVFIVWMLLFHGGIFLAACALAVRTERHRATLGQAQIARQTSEALLDAAELDALRAQVDPAFLLRVMAAVQARYVTDAAGADRLLDELVAFLRAAMPAVRSGASTLRAEVELACAYASLAGAIDPTRAAWRVDVAGSLAEMPFPPQLLLPLMERLGAEATPSDAARCGGRLAITGRDRHVTIVVEAAPSLLPSALPPALLYRLQVALRATFGDAQVFEVHAAGEGHGVALALHVEWPPREAPPRAVPQADPACEPPAFISATSRETRHHFVF